MQYNPHALYVHCDAAMDYDSKNSGGVGFIVKFPEGIEIEPIEKSIGRYVKANIERLELEAIIQGMCEVIRLFTDHKDELTNIKTIIITTDRLSLNDTEKTSTYRIREWRKNQWCNHEGKAIKNSDLLDKIDKLRKKLFDLAYCSVKIEYLRRKFNKRADTLSKQGKKETLPNDKVALKGVKIGKRKFHLEEINYKLLKEKEYYIVHVFKKDPVQNQWEINVEICEGDLSGFKFKIYTAQVIEKKLHRMHVYSVRIKKIYSHHITIYKTIKELKKWVKK